MVTIKIGKKRIKVFNCLIVLFIISLIIFLIITAIKNIIFYNVPKKFEYKDIYNNSVKVRFDNNLKSCDVKITYKLDKNDLIKEKLTDYKIKGEKYIKTSSYKGKCDKLIKEYSNSQNIEFYLNGEKDIKINYKDNYEDLGVVAKVNDKQKEVKIQNDVDTNVIGKYKVVYSLEVSKFRKEYLFRNVSVIDSIKPELKLKGKSNLTITKNSEYKEPGYTAIDNYDGDITSNVKIDSNLDVKKIGEYTIKYTIKDSSSNETSLNRTVKVIEKENNEVTSNSQDNNKLTYIKGILIVNKKYGLPKDYNPGVNSEANKALKNMQSAAQALNLNLGLISGFRSYSKQETLYNNYVKKYGKDTDTFSAKPGHSEHQTGLAFDVGSISDSFGETSAGKWLAQNCHLYGFIIRYPKGKQSITGYKYEPWHIRYLGVDVATKVYKSGLTLEEYLGIN